MLLRHSHDEVLCSPKLLPGNEQRNGPNHFKAVARKRPLNGALNLLEYNALPGDGTWLSMQ